MADLALVDIHWKMLCKVMFMDGICVGLQFHVQERPGNVEQENLFSRLVELTKLQASTKRQERKEGEKAGPGDPDIRVLLRNESTAVGRRGVVLEKYPVVRMPVICKITKLTITCVNVQNQFHVLDRRGDQSSKFTHPKQTSLLKFQSPPHVLSNQP